MSKALSRFRIGMPLEISCYHPDCANVAVSARLGREITREIHPSFRSVGFAGRMKWDPKKPMRAFQLENDVTCPNCRAYFRDALIFSRGKSRKPTIIGYEPEPV